MSVDIKELKSDRADVHQLFIKDESKSLRDKLKEQRRDDNKWEETDAQEDTKKVQYKGQNYETYTHTYIRIQ